MKNRKKMNQILAAFLFLIFAVGYSNVTPCLAASAKVDLTADSTEVTVGDKVSVYIKINSDTAFTNFESNLVYDEDVLEYQGGASVITGGSGYLKISDAETTQVSTSRKYALEFKALKVGNCNISFGDDVIVYNESGEEMPVSSDNLTIKVNAVKTSSTNANLKSLETSPVAITPAFDKNVFEYTADVSNDTEQLIISAIPEDDKAEVTVSGNDSLKEGQNKVVVTVLAESGDVIEYTINVYREPAPTNTAGDDTGVTTGNNQNTFNIIENNGEKYAVFSGLYQLVEPDGDTIIPAGYSKEDITISGVTVTAFVPEEDADSDFVLLYAENEAGERGFYQYDKAEKTLQRYVADSDTAANVNADRYQSKLNVAAIVIALLSTVSVFLIFMVLLLYRKWKTARKEDLE